MRKVISNKDRIEGYFAEEKNYQKLRQLCIKRYRDHNSAEDALHDIYVKLIKNFRTIDFPHNPDEVLPYMYEVIRNHFMDELKKRKDAPETLDGSEAQSVEEDETISRSMKLEGVNLYMQEHRALFTHDENTLWDCIFNSLSTDDKVKALGKTSNNLYVMRHRLLAKIYRVMKRDGLL